MSFVNGGEGSSMQGGDVLKGAHEDLQVGVVNPKLNIL